MVQELPNEGEQSDLPTFKINPKYKAMFPEPSTEEYEELEKSIEKYGQRDPVFVNYKREILDGHTRSRILRELVKRPIYVVKKFSTQEEELFFVCDCNLNKRQLNRFQRIESVVLNMEEAVIARAKARQLVQLKQAANTPLGQIDTSGTKEEEQGKAIEILAAKAHVAPGTYVKGSDVVKFASEEIKQQIRDDKLSIKRS